MIDFSNLSDGQLFWTMMGAGTILYLLGALSVLILVILWLQHYRAKADKVLQAAERLRTVELERIESFLKTTVQGMHTSSFEEMGIDDRGSCKMLHYGNLAIVSALLIRLNPADGVINALHQLLIEFVREDWDNIGVLNDWRARVSAVHVYIRHMRRPIGPDGGPSWSADEMADLRPGIGWTISRLEQDNLPWSLGPYALRDLREIHQELSPRYTGGGCDMY